LWKSKLEWIVFRIVKIMSKLAFIERQKRL
jgi:hypothetical protein